MIERALLQLRHKCRFLVLVLLAVLLPFTVAKGEEKVTGPEAESVRQTITGYILSDIKLKGGFFLYDPTLMRVVGMKFDRVHEGVTRTDHGQFFACVDMRDVRGSLYDLDVYLRKTDQGLKTSKLVIHKVDGEERPKAAD